MPLKEYVDSRFSTPEQITRYKSTQWVIGYILGIFIGPVYAAAFDAKATTYLGRSFPNIIACILMLVQILHVRYNMFYFPRNGCKASLDLRDDSETLLKAIFAALTSQGAKPLELDAWQ